MSSPLSAQNLDSVASFSGERIESIPLKNGGTVFIQRPKEKTIQAGGGGPPDDPDNSNVLTNFFRDFRISIGPVDMIIKYDPARSWIEITVTINIPIIGAVEIGKVSGNLKHGVCIKIGYSGIVVGEFGLRLDGNNVVLYWKFTAFGTTYDDEVVLFYI